MEEKAILSALQTSGVVGGVLFIVFGFWKKVVETLKPPSSKETAPMTIQIQASAPDEARRTIARQDDALGNWQYAYLNEALPVSGPRGRPQAIHREVAARR